MPKQFKLATFMFLQKLTKVCVYRNGFLDSLDMWPGLDDTFVSLAREIIKKRTEPQAANSLEGVNHASPKRLGMVIGNTIAVYLVSLSYVLVIVDDDDQPIQILQKDESCC